MPPPTECQPRALAVTPRGEASSEQNYILFVPRCDVQYTCTASEFTLDLKSVHRLSRGCAQNCNLYARLATYLYKLE